MRCILHLGQPARYPRAQRKNTLDLLEIYKRRVSRPLGMQSCSVWIFLSYLYLGEMPCRLRDFVFSWQQGAPIECDYESSLGTQWDCRLSCCRHFLSKTRSFSTVTFFVVKGQVLGKIRNEVFS